MEEQVVIAQCLCGKKALPFVKDYPESPAYFVRCECGRKTPEYEQLGAAIYEWNRMNVPQKAKVKYHCGYCGAEVYMGFAECPKCRTQIDW